MRYAFRTPKSAIRNPKSTLCSMPVVRLAGFASLQSLIYNLQSPRLARFLSVRLTESGADGWNPYRFMDSLAAVHFLIQ
jgi:hypothetical protein